MAIKKIYHFSGFTVDPVAHEMRTPGPGLKKPRPQIFAAIVYLIENREAAVSLREIWDHSGGTGRDVIYTEDLGYQIISQCRDALGDNDKSYIQHVGPKLYRFVGEVTEEIAPISAAERATVSQELENAVAAWGSVTFPELDAAVVEYYRGKSVPLYSYQTASGTALPVPLYVQPSWLNLAESSLHMARTGIDRDTRLSNEQQHFLKLYTSVRKRLGLKPLWNSRVFRLVRMSQGTSQLNLEFEETRFLDTLACQWILEHEIRCAIARKKTKRVRPVDLPLRESLASKLEHIETFYESQVARIGVSNLILLRKSPTMYEALIRARGSLSMGAVGNFDTPSSGIFDIATGQPEIDFSLEYKVLKEIYEEVFDGKEVEKEIRHYDPRFFYEKPGIKPLCEMLKNGDASFHVTGFCIDLVRMAPEITTVLVVREESYYQKHRTKMKTNLEYGASTECEIPRNIADVDGYLKTDFPSDPGRPEERRGFNPARWTLPGGFCFRQGLKRAVRLSLL